MNKTEEIKRGASWYAIESLKEELKKFAHSGPCCGCREMIDRAIEAEQEKYRR